MQILVTVGEAFQRLFGEIVVTANTNSGVIQRVREFTPASLAKTFILGHLKNPDASPQELAEMANQCGACVTVQGTEQRRTDKLVKFLQEIFEEAIKIAVRTNKLLAPILGRFTAVHVCDSTTVVLPDSLKEEFEGCGGSYDANQAVIKIQVELDLKSGAYFHIELEDGKTSDGGSCRQQARREKGSLRITDLGFFSGSVFEEADQNGEYFLSRLQFGTHILLADKTPVPKLLRWLEEQQGPFVDQSILLGAGTQLPCRIIAWRLPPEQANQRRAKIRAEMKQKSGKTPSEERLAWCDWSILVTNVPAETLTPEESVVLYRARWQIELQFKRWKSEGLIAQLFDSTDVKKMVRFWSRMIACVIQHWILVGTTWGDPRLSLDKAGATIRKHVASIVDGLRKFSELIESMQRLARTISKTCQRNKRTKPGTFELLNNPQLLDFCLN